MKLIVADSSPLIVFARSELLPILRQMVGEIVVPQTVYEECTGDMNKPGAKIIACAHQAGLLTVHRDSLVVALPTNMPMLDKGEIAAISLAIELSEPILMDERLGRQAATAHGLSVIGSAGILIAAKRKGLIAAVHPILLVWQGFGYFLSSKLIAKVLERAGEQPA
jgi:predicted nucleic acid-binding protein